METLQITEKTYNKGLSGAGIIVWAKDVPAESFIPPVGILEPDECFSEYRFALRLADGSDIFFSHEQVKVLAAAAAKVEAGLA